MTCFALNNLSLSLSTAAGAPVLLLLFNAGPLDVSWAVQDKRVQVILECFFPAQATGEALRHMFYLNGPGSNPAGRLPATWPVSLNQVCLVLVSDEEEQSGY